MKLNKIVILSLFIVLICFIGAVSATEDVNDTVITDSGIDEVKAYMSTSMYGYTLTNESSSTANYQLVYSGSYESTGLIYSFTKHEGGLYSVIDTELCVNKSVIIKYLKEHYSLVSGAGSDDENIQYLFTTPDKTTVITTLKVSDECFNVSYSFVTH